MDIKKPQLVKVGAFAYFFEGVLQHPPKFLAKLAGDFITRSSALTMKHLMLLFFL